MLSPNPIHTELKDLFRNVFCPDDTLEERLQDRKIAAKGDTRFVAKLLHKMAYTIQHPPLDFGRFLYESSGFYLAHHEDTPEEEEFSPAEYLEWFKTVLYQPMLALYVNHLRENKWTDERISKILGYDWEPHLS